MKDSITRRHFVKSATVTMAAASVAAPLFGQGGSSKTVKVAVVGCGGRGRHDLGKFMEACELLGKKAEVTALADAFEDSAQNLAKHFNVPANRAMWGYDSYLKAMESDAEYVILTAPPNFRPLHFEAAIAAGKHTLAEKPIAVDGPGIRKFIELGEKAKSRGLAIVAGTQRRHQLGYLRNKALIDAGAVGQILGGVVSWNGSVPWIWERKAGWDDAEYLARNWLNFVELSGDHICEQHVHNLDVANWFIGRTPVSAVGFGGRARRETGNQYDFFSVEYDYGDGVRIHSQCRQISGCYSRVGEFFRGAEGELFGGGKLSGKDVSIPEIKVDTEDSEMQEMIDLIRGVESDKPLNEALAVSQATATAVMGRISAYTGELVRWSDLMENKKSPHYSMTLEPKAKDFEKGSVKLPEENQAPVPGDGKEISRRG